MWHFFSISCRKGLFWPGEDAGKGLFVLQAVSPGQVLCEYRGKLLSTAEVGDVCGECGELWRKCLFAS